MKKSQFLSENLLEKEKKEKEKLLKEKNNLEKELQKQKEINEKNKNEFEISNILNSDRFNKISSQSSIKSLLQNNNNNNNNKNKKILFNYKLNNNNSLDFSYLNSSFLSFFDNNNNNNKNNSCIIKNTKPNEFETIFNKITNKSILNFSRNSELTNSLISKESLLKKSNLRTSNFQRNKNKSKTLKFSNHLFSTENDNPSTKNTQTNMKIKRNYVRSKTFMSKKYTNFLPSNRLFKELDYYSRLFKIYENSNGEFKCYESFCTAIDNNFHFYKNIDLYTNFQKPSKILIAKNIKEIKNLSNDPDLKKFKFVFEIVYVDSGNNLFKRFDSKKVDFNVKNDNRYIFAAKNKEILNKWIEILNNMKKNKNKLNKSSIIKSKKNLDDSDYFDVKKNMSVNKSFFSQKSMK